MRFTTVSVRLRAGAASAAPTPSPTTHTDGPREAPCMGARVRQAMRPHGATVGTQQTNPCPPPAQVNAGAAVLRSRSMSAIPGRRQPELGHRRHGPPSSFFQRLGCSWYCTSHFSSKFVLLTFSHLVPCRIGLCRQPSMSLPCRASPRPTTLHRFVRCRICIGGCRAPAAHELGHIADGSGAVLRARALCSRAPSRVV